MITSISIATVRSRDLCLGLFLVSFISYLLFSHLVPITDPVESNYVLTAKEMVESSDWLSPRIYGNVWFDKPVFFYWLTAIAFKVFGFSDLAARLVPALFAGVGVVMVYWFLTKTASQAAALLGALVLGTSLEYVLLAKFVITDMVLFVFNNAALAFFYLGYTRVDDTKRWYFAMYASMALAVLTKGPVGLLLPGLVMVIFIGVQRNWAELRRMYIPAGVLIFSMVALPWYAAMYFDYGSDFVNIFFGVHNYLRATVSEHPKDNVSYYYVLIFLLGMLPWSPITLKAMIAGCKDRSLRKSSLWLFSFIWVGVYFTFYSFMATKYLTYTFPMFFPLAVIAGIYLEQLINQDNQRTIIYWVGIPMVLATLAYLAAAYRYLGSPWLVAAVGSLVILTWWKIKKQPTKHALGLLCLCQIAVYMTLSLFVFSAMADSKSGKELAQNMIEYNGNKIGLYEFYSTSAVYYSGKVAVKVTSSEEATSPQPGSLSWSSKYTMPTESLSNFVTNAKKDSIVIIVPEDKRKRFLEESKNLNPRLLRTKDGFSYYYLGV
ncbi:ArnT family glycosyltransferase [Sporomusa malonica]|uniref:Dolichyl-phosphate-mannose-protein mannosyltransferase n=1 Tax=Sporomusa malonica TaxID=112901 RepID=A0A1W2DXY9_9FIRM|nr:glycosyltransferase family 39 protein [Sporomusa malonica]SMD01698.1 Dolichyl-phosphate-mannose-protein mannosyltransferase [Sporomusa malonica]